jgi:hypothetical protein
MAEGDLSGDYKRAAQSEAYWVEVGRDFKMSHPVLG